MDALDRGKRLLGVTPSALHYHFPGGKEEVVAALFERDERRVLDAMAAAMAKVKTPHGRLLAIAAGTETRPVHGAALSRGSPRMGGQAAFASG